MEGRHTGENLAVATKAAIPEGVIKEVIAIVSDSAANMNKMKAIFVREVPTAFYIPCALHILNLASQDILKIDGLKGPARAIITFASFFNKSYYFSDMCAKWGKSKGLKGRVRTFCVTRWFGFFDCVNSILAYQNAFKDIFDNLTDQGKENLKQVPPKIREILNDPSFFGNCQFLSDIFSPLCAIIKQLESDSASISQVLPKVFSLYLNYQAKEQLSYGSQKGIYKAITHIITKRGKVFLVDYKVELNPFILSFYFNPQFRSQATSLKYSSTDYLHMLLLLLKKWNYTSKAFVNKCVQQLNCYSKQVPPFNTVPFSNVIEYWEKLPNMELKEVIQKLLFIVPHSAMCERLFSSMSYMKKKWQNQMKAETLEAYIKIKMAFSVPKTERKTANNDKIIEVEDDGILDDLIISVDEDDFVTYIDSDDFLQFDDLNNFKIEEIFDLAVPLDEAHLAEMECDEQDAEWDINDFIG